MNKRSLYLWCAHPDDLSAEGVARACAALLSPEELARWQKFRFDWHRRESLTTRALARTALSHYHPIPPEAWHFKANAYGKPVAEPDCGLRFNLSNSDGLVVCLIAERAEVGVDVEPCKRAGEILNLAPEVFSAAEQAQLEALRDDEKPNRALSLWTLKEAYIKARGFGLSFPLRKFSFLFGDREGIRLEVEPGVDDEPGRWRFCLLDHAGHRIAMMVEGTPERELQLWEARPVLAPPVLVSAGGEPWFPHSHSLFLAAHKRESTLVST
jgi:4'-phosphopantetheinyl transferase